MNDPFLTRLMREGASEIDLAFIAENYRNVVNVEAQSDISGRGASAKQIHVLLDGWACKYRLMADGRRQILRIHLPGEICDLDKICRDDVSFGVLALSECRIATISLDWIKKAIEDRPAIRDLLWSLTVFESVAMTEQVVSLGRRSARERTAYLLCDLLQRLQALGQADDGSFRLPLTQVDMGDHLGLSTVHVNRTLQDLKSERLIQNGGRTYRICDREGLERLGQFQRSSASYDRRLDAGQDTRGSRTAVVARSTHGELMLSAGAARH